MLKQLALSCLFVLLMCTFSYAQIKVDDGTVSGSTVTPNPNAVLDLSSIQRGVLFPRLSLESTTSPAPLTKHEAGMMVYNLSKKNDVVPGIYYNDGTKWVMTGGGKGSGITYDPTTNVITFLDENGNPVTIDLQEIIKKSQTITTLTKEVNGTYTYVSEDNTITVIDVPGDVINNFEEIIKNQTVLNELTQIINEVGGNITYDGSSFTWIDENGDVQNLNLEQIIKGFETITTLDENGNAKYTYTSESGKVTVIDVPADVINNFEEIFNNPTILNELTEIINKLGGNVSFDGTDFTWMDKNGNQHTVDLEQLVKDNQVVTTLVNNGDGTYTYTSEDGTQTTIDVPADVVNNFEEIIKNGDVQNILNEYITNVEGNVSFDGSNFTYVDGSDTVVIDLNDLVKLNETVTTLVNNGDGTYTYTSEDGTQTTIDVPADVIQNFEEIIKNGDVQNILNEYITNVEGNVSFDGSNFTYVDGSDTVVIDLNDLVKLNETVTTLVNNGDGTYTYTSEDGTQTTIDVPADVIQNFEEIIKNGDVQNILNEYITNVEGNVSFDGSNFTYVDGSDTVVIDLNDLVKLNETVTTLVNNGDGTYTYTSEDGTQTTIDVPADVIQNFEEIIKNGDVQNILNEYITNVEGNVSFDGSNFTYVDGSDTVVIDLNDLVKLNETVTTLVNNGDGTYTYTSEDGTQTTIDVPADVIQNFEEIIKNGDVQNILNEYITNVEGNVSFDGSNFTYVDGSDTVVIDLNDLVKLNETVTTLVSNGDGTYTYTSEDGTQTTIDVPADVIQNFEEIIKNGDVQNILNEYITNVEGNVSFDGSNFTYVDGSDTVVIDLNDLVKLNETVTTLVNNGDGTYTYTSEDGTQTTIDVPADVIQNFEEIIKNGDVQNILNEYITNVEGNVSFDGSNFTYVDGSDTVVIDLNDLVKLNETVTTLVNNGDGTYTYTSEDGTQTTIDVPADVIQNFEEIIKNGDVQNILNEYITNVEGNVSFDGSNFTYVDGSDTVVIDLNDLVKLNETVTTLVNNGDGTYTYTSEDGTQTTIDVPADVVNNFEEIIKNGDVQNILNEYITNVEGNVSFDGSNFTYVDGSDTVVIDLNDLVKLNETVTTLVSNGDGTYTYTSEDGTQTTIDVPADVVNNFEEIIKNGDVQNILNEYITNVEGNVSFDGSNFTYVDGSDTVVIDLNDLVKLNETVTTLVNNGDGTYTYTSEDGTQTTIDVPADVIQNFEEIVNNPAVTNILNEFITNVEGNVSFDGSNFTYIDGSDTVVIDLNDLVKLNETVTTLVNNGDGTYTYTSEDGTQTTIDVPADVVNNFEEIIKNGDVQNILNEYITNVEGNVSFDGSNFTYIDGSDTVVIDLNDLVKLNETVTTLVSNGDGTYTYTSEDGTQTTIDVPADVVNNFEEIIKNGDVQNILNEYITNVEGNVSFDGSNFTYVDGSDTVVIDLNDLVKLNETVTTLVNNGDGTYTYTSEDGTQTTIDVPADVIQNFEEIVNNPAVTNILNEFITNVEGNVSFDGSNFTYIDGSDTVVIDLNDLVKLNETVTTLVNNGDGTYTYTSEDGTQTTIDVPADVVNNFEEIIKNGDVQNILNEYITNVEGNVSFDGSNFTYVDGSDTVVIDLNDLVKLNETVTTLVNNGDGTYTYTSEDGTQTTIDVPADVIQNFEEIIKNGDVQNILNEYITNVEGNVSFDGSNFTYIDGSDTVVIDLNDLVKLNETVTTLVNNGDGTYTYTSEDGTQTTIDVPADVIQNFEEIIKNGDVQNILNEYITNVEGNVSFDGSNFTYVDGSDTVVIDLNDLVKLNETVTTLVNNGDGTYTYTSEDGTQTTIDVPADVIQNFEEIVNNPAVTNILNEFITNVEGNVSFDGSKFTYVDGSNVVDVDISTIVKDNETLTTLIMREEEIDDPEVPGQKLKEYFLQYKDEHGELHDLEISTIVKAGETLTTLSYDGALHQLVYTDEQGNATPFDLVDLVGDAQTLTTLRIDIDNKRLVYMDENEQVHNINLGPIVQEPWFSVATKTGATSNTDDVYIQGWVGIGTDEKTSAINEKLRVNGSITTINSYYADYVFEDYFEGESAIKLDYKFKTLDEVESFVKTHRHLPGITPIDQLEKTAEGYSFNVSELSIQLLEKTEELYLHVIEQNNKIKEQKGFMQIQSTEIQNLKKESESLKERLEKLERMLLEKK